MIHPFRYQPHRVRNKPQNGRFVHVCVSDCWLGTGKNQFLKRSKIKRQPNFMGFIGLLMNELSISINA